MTILSKLASFLLIIVSLQYFLLGLYHFFSAAGMSLGDLGLFFPIFVIRFIEPLTLIGPLAPLAPLEMASYRYTIFNTMEMSWDFGLDFTLYSFIIALTIIFAGVMGFLGLYEIHRRNRMHGNIIWMILIIFAGITLIWNFYWWGVSHDKATGFSFTYIFSDIIKFCLYVVAFILVKKRYKYL